MDKARILWKVFYLYLGLVAINVAGTLFGWDFATNKGIQVIILILPLILLVLHAFWTLSIPRGIFFILLASGIGFLSEYVGLNTGTVFGGYYVYRPHASTILGVPTLVMLYWAVFTYTGYCVTTSFLYWLKRNKPSIKRRDLSLMPLLVLVDGLIVVAIDLFMDPLEVALGNWTWLEGGPYFGVPLGNFVGWFIVTILITGTFRLFEYLVPQKGSDIHTSVFLIPVIGYGMMALAFGILAVSLKMYGLAAIGLLLMLPVTISNVILNRSHRLSRIN